MVVSYTRAASLRKRFEGSSEKIWPSRMWTTRCAYSAMSGSCVTSTMVLPLACKVSNRAMISMPVLESRLPVGSSARMMEGLIDQGAGDGDALALAAGELVGLVIHAAFEAHVGQRFLGALDACGGRRAVVDQGQLDVVQRGGAGQQVEGLEDEADFLVADARQLDRRPVR